MVILFGMLVWQWGKKVTRKSYDTIKTITVKELIALKEKSTASLPRTFIVMTPYETTSLNDHISVTGQVILDRYGISPFNIIFVKVKTHRVPSMERERYSLHSLYSSKTKGSVTGVVLHYGFMESPKIEYVLEDLAKKKKIPTHTDRKQWTIHIIRNRFYFFKGMSFFREILMHIYRYMYTGSKTMDEYYGLGNRIRLSINILPVKTK